jgi:hypothetical protein
MANFERNEPTVDPDHLFDDDDLEPEDGEEEEGARLPMLLVLGLLVIAAFAGVVWLAYTQGVQRGLNGEPSASIATSAPPPVQSAPPAAETPPITAPANPPPTGSPASQAATGVPASAPSLPGAKLYQQPAPQDEDTTAHAPSTGLVAAPAVPPASAPHPTKTAPQQVAQAAPAPKPFSAAPARPQAVHLEPPAAALPNAPTTAPAAETPPAPAQSSPAPSAPVAAAPAPAAVPAKAGAGMALQIGAYKSEADADAAWAAFRQHHAMTRNYRSDVRKVDLGAKGTWYRLRLVPFADKTAALAFCTRLKADGGACFLAK